MTKQVGTFLGPQLGIVIAGDFAYAYSGSIALDNTTDENTYLEFTTGKYTFVGHMQANISTMPGAGTDDVQYTAYFNGVIVQSYIVGGAKQYSDPDNPLYLIIPPMTTVKITAKDITQASVIANTISLTGRIYR